MLVVHRSRAASNRSMPAEDSTVAHNLSFCVCSSRNIDHYKISVRVEDREISEDPAPHGVSPEVTVKQTEIYNN